MQLWQSDCTFASYFPGRDFAADDEIAAEMVNFVYLVGDRVTRETLVIDPAYDVDGIVSSAEADGMTITGVLATQHHQDHVDGGISEFGVDLTITGVKELVERLSIPIHVQRAEADLVEVTTGVGSDHLVSHDTGDVVTVGGIDIELIHTPGHTPGSQCFLVDGRLLAGDTLFLEARGRTDLPGSDPVAMYESLTQRLAKVPDGALLFPGHLYSAE